VEFTNNWLALLAKALFQFFGLTAGTPVTFDLNGKMTDYAVAVGSVASYPKTTSGAQTLLASALVDRVVIIVVTIAETFANNTGTKPSFDIGETGTTHKFKQTLNSGTAGDVLVYTGTLAAVKALLITGTAAIGDAAGGITVAVHAAPAV
jgi:hypothetical protein